MKRKRPRTTFLAVFFLSSSSSSRLMTAVVVALAPPLRSSSSSSSLGRFPSRTTLAATPLYYSSTHHHDTDPDTNDESSLSSSSSSSLVHTLLLCRHGDSIWNGGEPGTRETFTGWTNVPLSQKGIAEAQATGRLLSENYQLGIDACFTSILQRAQLTAHYCLWGFAEQPNAQAPRKYFQDYRLNERHYGALQGFVKEEVEQGKYGHPPELVQQWRRSWYTVPPLLDNDDDPRRIQEVKAYSHFCGGPERVPRGESLEQVAEHRIRPFLEERLCPVLSEAAQSRRKSLQQQQQQQQQQFEASSSSSGEEQEGELLQAGGTGLVVAHANSLRALIGVICNVQEDPVALKTLEGLRLQTGVPLVLRFRYNNNNNSNVNNRTDTPYLYSYQPCTVDGLPFCSRSSSSSSSSSHHTTSTVRGLAPELPVYPLSSIPMKRSDDIDAATQGNSRSTSNASTNKKKKILTVPF